MKGVICAAFRAGPVIEGLVYEFFITFISWSNNQHIAAKERTSQVCKSVEGILVAKRIHGVIVVPAEMPMVLLYDGYQSFIPRSDAFVFGKYPLVSPIALGKIIEEFHTICSVTSFSNYAWIVTA